MTSMNALFIVNPRAGRGVGQKVWDRIIQKRVARSRLVDAVIPASVAETRKLAAEAVKTGIHRVIVVGGDGTLVTVAAELAFSGTALGVVPAGTGNDFCRNTGIPRDPSAALEIALGLHTRRIDLGGAPGGNCFLNVAGIGFDAEVAVAARSFPSGLGGTLPYLLGAFTTMFRFQPLQVDATVDDQPFAGPAMMVAVANGRGYAGGMQIAPRAQQWDGKLDVCIVGSLGRLELVNLLRQVYSGAHVRHPKITMLRGEQVRVTVKGEARAHLDGEPYYGDSLTFQVQPGALSVAMPPLSSHAVDPQWAAGHSRPGSSDINHEVIRS